MVEIRDWLLLGLPVLAGLTAIAFMKISEWLAPASYESRSEPEHHEIAQETANLIGRGVVSILVDERNKREENDSKIYEGVLWVGKRVSKLQAAINTLSTNQVSTTAVQSSPATSAPKTTSSSDAAHTDLDNFIDELREKS